MNNIVMAIKIEVYKRSKILCFISKNIEINKLIPAFIKSLGLPSSIYISGINKNIIPKNK